MPPGRRCVRGPGSWRTGSVTIVWSTARRLSRWASRTSSTAVLAVVQSKSQYIGFLKDDYHVVLRDA